MDITKFIYFDNNATVPQSLTSIREQAKWARCSNGSAQNPVARMARDTCNKFEKILSHDLNAPEIDYTQIWTSGTSEGNCMIISMFTETVLPVNKHIICTTIEHKCLLNAVKQAESRIPVTWIDPCIDGRINPDDIVNAVNSILASDPNAYILVTVMHANNETGAINDIETIGRHIKHPGVFFHVDTAQTFGKLHINMAANGISSIAWSAHKIGGPFGVGSLIVSRKFLEALGPEKYIPITGEQNDHMRGGTYNIPGIIAAGYAYSEITANGKMEKHNAILQANKDKFIAVLDKYIPVIYYDEHMTIPTCPCIVIFSGKGISLPNTILMSIVFNGSDKEICNIRLRKYLEERNIIVSLGSACNSNSAGSHVLNAMGIPRELMLGTLRISAWDNPWSDYLALINALRGLFSDIGQVCIPRTKGGKKKTK